MDDIPIAEAVKSSPTEPSSIFLVKQTTQQAVLVFLIWATILIFLYYFKIKNGLTLLDLSILLFNFITTTTWGPFLYILVYTIRPLTFFPGSALTVLSGVFFGLWGGIIYTLIGANLSSVVGYFIGRYFSTKGDKPRSVLNRWGEALELNPFSTILTFRLAHIPYDLVNYGAGLFKVPFVPYILATIIGTSLGIVAFVVIGTSIDVSELIQNGITREIINSKFAFISVIIGMIIFGLENTLRLNTASLEKRF